MTNLLTPPQAPDQNPRQRTGSVPAQSTSVESITTGANPAESTDYEPRTPRKGHRGLWLGVTAAAAVALLTASVAVAATAGRNRSDNTGQQGEEQFDPDGGSDPDGDILNPGGNGGAGACEQVTIIGEIAPGIVEIDNGGKNIDGVPQRTYRVNMDSESVLEISLPVGYDYREKYSGDASNGFGVGSDEGVSFQYRGSDSSGNAGVVIYWAREGDTGPSGDDSYDYMWGVPSSVGVEGLEQGSARQYMMPDESSVNIDTALMVGGRVAHVGLNYGNPDEEAAAAVAMAYGLKLVKC
ncbi:hypothetical protein FWG95_00555 [Candidatus Saccharibacteria bacterium]|nr:hypothetical protein [Candidatus Saccharibacteria bacterium]